MANSDGVVLSVVIPCRNEVRHIERCVLSILGGTFDELELIVVDGDSDDGTPQLLAALAEADSRLKVIHNPQRIIPSALNLGFAAARGHLLQRMDAHTSYPPEFLHRSVQALERTQADGVGGRIETVPSEPTLVGRTIAALLMHPIGAGNSSFRRGVPAAREADTLFSGCYRREALLSAFPLDERIPLSEDLIMNAAIRRHGFRLVYDPTIVSKYYARSTVGSFLRHNWRNGVWSVLPMAWTEEAFLSARHLVPGTVVAGGLALLTAAAAWGGRFTTLLAVGCGSYGVVALAASVDIARREREPLLAIVSPGLIVGLHIPYGIGSLYGALRVVWTVLSGRRGQSQQ